MSFLTDPNILVNNSGDFNLASYRADYSSVYNKESAKGEFKRIRKSLSNLQEKLYAQDRYSILLIFQAMDAAGKDGTIRSVMTGVNPQGCSVVSFKSPSQKELDHDFLWRCYKDLPERGRIGIFNRSYYEEVLVTKVHPQFIINQRIPGINSVEDITDEFWQKRYQSITNFEEHLFHNGVVILKFFLNVSKEEQKLRFLDRINVPEKNWKFNPKDLEERKKWDEYQKAYQMAIQKTASDMAPWFIIPSDSNWMRNLIVSAIISETLEKLKLGFPKLSQAEMEQLHLCKVLLETE